MTDDWIDSTANTAHRLMTGRIEHMPPVPDPSASEIANQIEEGADPSRVRSKLIEIRDQLADRASTGDVHLVSETYYDEYRTEKPQSVSEAKPCVCHFRSAYGLRIPSGGIIDFIYQADKIRNWKCGTGKQKKNGESMKFSVLLSEMSTEKLQDWHDLLVTPSRFEQMIHTELEARGTPPEPLFNGQRKALSQ